jgi:preprotein translocase subunit SecG
MLFTFILVIQTIVAAALVAVILMQRSEGGGLGVGGSSSGLMTARGAADFLTRATAVLATLFVILSIVLAGLAAIDRSPSTIDPSLARQRAPTTPIGQTAPVPGQVNPGGGVPLADDPLAGAAASVPTANTSSPRDQIRPVPQAAPTNEAAPKQ